MSWMGSLSQEPQVNIFQDSVVLPCRVCVRKGRNFSLSSGLYCNRLNLGLCPALHIARRVPDSHAGRKPEAAQIVNPTCHHHEPPSTVVESLVETADCPQPYML